MLHYKHQTLFNKILPLPESFRNCLQSKSHLVKVHPVEESLTLSSFLAAIFANVMKKKPVLALWTKLPKKVGVRVDNIFSTYINHRRNHGCATGSSSETSLVNGWCSGYYNLNYSLAGVWFNQDPHGECVDLNNKISTTFSGNAIHLRTRGGKIFSKSLILKVVKFSSSCQRNIWFYAFVFLQTISLIFSPNFPV